VPLVRGVRLISLYTLATGFLYLPQVRNAPDKNLPEDVAKYKVILGYTLWFINLMGVVMGFQGLLGLKTGDARKLRRLFIYYLLKLIVEIPRIMFHEAYVCLSVEAAKKQHPDKDIATCDKVRASYRQVELADVVMFAVFAHAVWSMAKRLETSDFEGLENYGPDYGDSYLPLINSQTGANIQSTGPFAGPFANRATPLGAPTAPTQRPRVDRQNLTPFSGQAFRLDSRE